MKFVKPLYTVTEIAELLGRPESTVRGWIKKGDLPSVEFAGKRYVALAALQAQGLVWSSIELAASVNERRAA